MDAPMLAALVLAAVLAGLGVGSAGGQVRARRRLAARPHVPSDERRFLSARYRRRLWTSAVLVALGAMLAGAYLSGMEGRADALGAPRPAGGPRELNDDDRAFLKFWMLYWAAAVAMAFALVALALADVWATRRYLASQLKELREEHNVRLRRELAVLRSQRTAARGTGGWKRGGQAGDGA